MLTQNIPCAIEICSYVAKFYRNIFFVRAKFTLDFKTNIQAFLFF